MKHIPEESKKLIKNLPKNKKNGKDFNKLFSFAHPDAIDLLKKLLTFDPEKRITVTEALAHPYLADLHLEEDEPIRESVDYLDFEFEDHNLTTQQLKGTSSPTQTSSTKKSCSTTTRNSTESTRERKQARKVLSPTSLRTPTPPTSILMLILMSDTFTYIWKIVINITLVFMSDLFLVLSI